METRPSIHNVFLWRTPTASGAMRILFDHNCAAQLHSTLPNVYSTDVSSSPSSFLAGSTVDKYQLLGQAVLSRLGTVSNSIV